jgi:hypothetical protein
MNINNFLSQDRQQKNQTDEGVWQKFFEKTHGFLVMDWSIFLTRN